MYKGYMMPDTEQKAEDIIEISYTNNNMSQPKQANSLDFEFSQKKLQEAIIWSEILGKPMCMRRKRRNNGY